MERSSRTNPAGPDSAPARDSGWTAAVVSPSSESRERWRSAMGELALAEQVIARSPEALADAPWEGDAPRLFLVDLDPDLGEGTAELLRSLRDRPAVVVGYARASRRAVAAFAIRSHGFYLGRPEPNRIDRCLRAIAGRCLGAPAREDTSPRDGRPVLERLTLRSRGRMVLLPLAEINWIAADRNYVVFHAGTRRLRHRDSIGRLATTLDRRRFLRVDRSTIVHLDRIQGLVRAPSGTSALAFRDGSRLPASPRVIDHLLERVLRRRSI